MAHAGAPHPVGPRGDEPHRPRAAEDHGAPYKLWIVMARAFTTIVRRADAHLGRYGLTPAEFGTLDLLYHKGPLLLGEIQRMLLVSSGGITFLVDRLAEKGLVERMDCPEDRRARYAVLTRDGERLMAQIFPEQVRYVETLLEGLDPAEQAKATELLRKLGRAAAELPMPGKEPDARD